MYAVKIPWWLRFMYRSLIWQMPITDEKKIYLTFDDGPHAEATPFVLDQLKKYNAKATFFCIGKNVRKHPDIYQRIIAEGHSVGNHTNNHLNGWNVHNTLYIGDIQQACDVIKSDLFRPPYGRIRRAVIKRLHGKFGSPKVQRMRDRGVGAESPANAGSVSQKTVNGQWSMVDGLSSPVNRLPSKVVMWTVLAGDFDIKITREKCLKNVLDNTTDGSIVVFHDSTKAWGHMSYALPYVLAHFAEEGYRFEKI